MIEHATPSLSVDGGTPNEWHENLQHFIYFSVSWYPKRWSQTSSENQIMSKMLGFGTTNISNHWQWATVYWMWGGWSFWTTLTQYRWIMTNKTRQPPVIADAVTLQVKSAATTGHCRPTCFMLSLQGFLVTSFQDNNLWWCCSTDMVS
jgi:hypothetical protein